MTLALDTLLPRLAGCTSQPELVSYFDIEMTMYSLLQPWLDKFDESLGHADENTRTVLLEIARRHPDLQADWASAMQTRDAVKLEAVFTRIKHEIADMVAADALPPDTYAPYLHHLRINLSTKRLHVGHGERSISLFDDDR